MERSYPNRPFIGVGVVVIKEDRVLLIKRGKPPRLGEWSLPGGVQEIGETVFGTAAREVLEETGIEIGKPSLIDVIDSIQRDKTGDVRFHYTLIDVAAHWSAGEPIAGSDAIHTEWIPLGVVSELEMWFETYRIIAEGKRLLNELGTSG